MRHMKGRLRLHWRDTEMLILEMNVNEVNPYQYLSRLT